MSPEFKWKVEMVLIHKNAGKPNHLCELKDFSEEQQEVQDKQGTREQLSLNKKQLWIIQVTTQY